MYAAMESAEHVSVTRQDLVNRQLHNAQLYSNTRLNPDQSVQSFDAYLSGIEAQIPPFSEEHRRIKFFTKLRLDL